jgi:FkbM family methyltransferase
LKLFQATYTTIKYVAHLLGFDIVRSKNNPSTTLLGLRGLPFRTIIDVGANTGQFAREISTIFPNARLYCFEPLPETFSILSAWSEKQKESIVPYNLAIGDKECNVEIFLHQNHTPSSSLLRTTGLNEKLYPFTRKQKPICVSQTTLDAVFEAGTIELLPKLLIKVDVQGYEDRVIAGGQKTFAAASACILEVCLDTLYEGQTGFKELLMMLNDLGYRYAGNMNQTYGDDGHCIFLDAVFMRKEEFL